METFKINIPSIKSLAGINWRITHSFFLLQINEKEFYLCVIKWTEVSPGF